MPHSNCRAARPGVIAQLVERFVRIEGGNHARNLEQGGLKAVDVFLTAVEAKLPEYSTDRTVTAPRQP